MSDLSNEEPLSVQDSLLVDSERVTKYESLLLNCICVGQWEIARALIRTLYEEKAAKNYTGELLKVLILEGNEFWGESSSTPSPHHLQWLGLQEYNSLFGELEGELPEFLRTAVEFRLLLFAARELEFYNTEVANFLCLYHDHHVVKMPVTKTAVVGTSFSRPCLQFLRNCLYDNPELGHAIINRLMCDRSKENLANNQELQGLFLKCIDGSLNSLLAPNDGSQYEQSESEGHSEFQHQYISLTYSLLSLMDPSADMTELELDRVFLRILELTGDMELKLPGIFFDSKKIYSCLLGRKTNFLISRFQVVEEFKRKNQQRQQLQQLVNDEEDENAVIHRRAMEREKWRMLFFETLHSHQHMLEHVLLKGLQLISIGELEQLTDLISAPEYGPLKPLLLLLGWDRYPHNGSGQELLETLWTPEGSTQPLLHAACYKLSYQVALVQWCLDKARPFLQLHSTPFQSKATEMFDGLETHSVLYVLHHSTPLACLNPAEVIEILRMRPHVPSVSGGTTPPYPFSGSATPTKHVAAAPTFMAGTPTYMASTPSLEMNKLRATTPSPTSLSGFHYPRKLKPEQERDIAIYQAFCAIKLVMDALYLCANKKSSQLSQDESSLKQSSSRKRSISSRRRLISASDKDQPEVVKSLDLPLLKDKPDESFELGIKVRLHKAADFVSLIQPLNFRLEILENIFSLLFLKYEDITEYKKLSAFDTGLLMNTDTKEGEPMQDEKQALEMLQQQLSQDAPSVFSTGFIVSEQFADELLTILQDCLLDLTSAKYAMRRQSSVSGIQITEPASSTESVLESSHMNCAIGQSSLHQHITRLKQYINEAKWRLQLITSKMVMKQERLSDDESDEYLSAGQYLSSPDVKNEEMVSIEASSVSLKRLFSKSEEASNVDELFVPQLQRSESSLSHASNKLEEASKLQPVKEDSGVEADNEEALELLKKKSLASKRTRSFSKANNTEEAGKSLSPLHFKTPTQSNQDVVSSMLASPQSLLYMCLQQGNYDKAKEILKMFNMEGQLGEALVLFTESYIAIKEEFRQTSKFSTPKSSPQVYNYMDSKSSGETTPDSNKSSTPTVESLKLLGAAKKETPNIALQTALLTCTTVAPPLDSIHKLLASPFIDSMLFAGDSDLEAQVTVIPTLQTLKQHMPTLILLDVLCTNCMSGDVARRLVAMAAQRCGQIIATIPSSWSSQTAVDPAGLDFLTDLPTPLAVLNIFINLSSFYVTLPSTLNEAKSKLDAGFSLVKNFVCPFDFINGYHYVFRSNTIVHYCRFMEQLHEQFGTLEVIIEQVTVENLDVLEYARTVKANKPGTPSKQRQAVEALISSLYKDWSCMDELSETAEVHRVNYLQALYTHLGNVASMLNMLFTVYDGAAATTAMVTSGMQEMPHPLVMLGDSPTHILGRMIFEKKFPPEMLDSFAYNLRMNLVEVIVKGCCPPIESKPATPTRSATPTVAGLAGSLKSSVFPVVLNNQEALSLQLDPTNLCDLSFNLLNRMMTAIKDIPRSSGGYVGLKEISYASNYPDVITTMADTHLLADIDLQLLDTDNKKMVFFANIVNLLYCHCLLLYGLYQAETTAIEVPPALIPLFNSIEDGSWLSHLNLFSCVGYRIGQLGVISCLDLHYCILLHGLSPYTPELPHPFSCVLTDNDPWLKYCCSAPANPQLLFVVGNGWISSPLPRPLHLEDSELELAEQDYLDGVVTIDADSNQVTVSRLLHDHCNIFVRSSDSLQSNNVETGLLKYLLRKLPSQSSATLKQLMEEASTPAKSRKGSPPSPAIKVTVKPHKPKFGYLLPATVGTPLLRSYSLASSSPVLSRSTSQVDPGTVPTKSLHNLNTKTLQYIQQRFGLIASLLQLLCQVDSGEAKSPSTEEPEDTKEIKPVKAPSLFKSLKAQTPTKEQKGKQLGEVAVKKQKKWSESYSELLECFSRYTPFRAYMESRVLPFEEILYFHAIEKPLEGGQSKRLNRHPPVADIGLASSQSKVLYDATSYALRRLTKNKEFYKALNMLSSEPLINCAEDSFLVVLKQTILRVIFLCLLDRENAPNPVSLLARLNDHDLCARLALQSVRHWPIETCVDVLSMCGSRLPMDSALLSVVNTELKRMKIYSEIMCLCNLEGETQDSAEVEPSPLSVKWLSWTRLADDSASKPRYVLGQLITLKQYELARQWATMHDVAQNLKEWIEVQYLLDVLTESNASKARAQQVLDGLCDDACRLSVCKQLLDKSQLDFTSQLFVLHYIILKLASILEKPEMEKYANHALGIKALLCLPESSWIEFSSLVTEPFTLIEQLLMNMKLEWAASVITFLREDEMYCHLNSSGGPGVHHLEEKPFTTDCIDQLLTYYALKALEFPPPVILTPQEAFTAEQSMMASRQMTPSQSRIPSPLHHLRSRTTTMLTIHEQKGDSTVAENQEIFQPPPIPPPSHKWEQDSRVTKCRVCKGIFGLFNRRHHCRRCGRVVCSNCSPKQMTVDGYDRPQRVCIDCYNFRFPPKLSSEDDSEGEAGNQTNPSLPQAAVIPPDLSLPYTFNRYRLKVGDHLTNVEIRSDFNYHGSPDCPLFISLLELHSDRKQCADFILDRAHVVSLQLMPNDRGQLNEEIDKQFVVGIIRYLLISAKVKFSTAGCHDCVELCDTYLSRVDLLKMFVSSNYKKIPSIQELTQQDSSRRIRDQLLHDDRFSLAMEISTKCNLDTTGVWAAWGMSWLKVGNFEKAREKLRHCFMQNLQSMGTSSQNAALLGRVIEAIESAPLASVHEPHDDWSAVIHAAVMLLEKQDQCFLDKYRYDECMYYLKNYGSQSAKVSFLFKHGFVQKACKYILEQQCSTDLFLEALLIPALKRGQFEAIKHELRMCDPSLKLWEPHLVAACRYFSRRQLFAILYEMQIFMKDFIRASMTCIKFYTGFSGKLTSITDLYNRIAYLYKAEEHLKAYQETKAAKPATDLRTHLAARLGASGHEEGLAVMALTTEEIVRHISSIKLQVEVTEYLYKCFTKRGARGGSVPMVTVQQTQQPATLFGGTPVRSQVACQVLLWSSSIDVGFPLVIKILKAFYLPRGKFFSQVASMLTANGRTDDIHHLLECVKTNDQNHAMYTDDIILAAVKELAKTPNNEPKEIDKLVFLLNSDVSKINAFIQCGKLKSAYLTAIKGRYVEEVKRISTIATQAGQTAIRDICDRWLQMNASART